MTTAPFAVTRAEWRRLTRSTARRLALGLLLLALALAASPGSGYGQPLQSDSTGPEAAAVAAPGAATADVTEEPDPWAALVAVAPSLLVEVSDEVAYMPPIAPAARSATMPAEVDDIAEPAALGVKADVDRFEVGAEYRSVGRRLERVVPTPQARKDQEGSEVWLARRFGVLRLRVSQSDLSDNVDRNPALPRTTKAQTAALAEVAPRGWPILGLTYATGDSERVWLTPAGQSRGVGRQTFDSVAASVYYDGAMWQASASTRYATSADRGRPERETTAVYQDAALSLRLAPAVALTGTATVGQEQDWASAARSDIYSAFLTLTYAPGDSRWHAWTLAGQTSRRSNDASVDGRSVTVGGGVGHDLGKLFSGRARLSVEGGYDQYVDRVAPSGSSQAAYGFLRLTFPAF